jgi:glycerol kinase
MIQTIKSIGITNQRETCLAWDKSTGEHLTNAVVWHDTRTANIVEEIINRHSKSKDCFRSICGLPVNTYFSAVKMKWMIENEENLRERFNKEDYSNVCFGTIDSWIVFVKKFIYFRN